MIDSLLLIISPLFSAWISFIILNFLAKVVGFMRLVVILSSHIMIWIDGKFGICFIFMKESHVCLSWICCLCRRILWRRIIDRSSSLFHIRMLVLLAINRVKRRWRNITNEFMLLGRRCTNTLFIFIKLMVIYGVRIVIWGLLLVLCTSRPAL